MKVSVFLKMIFLAISPLAVILLFVGLISFTSRYFEHKNEVERLLETGTEVTGIIASYNPDMEDDRITLEISGKESESEYAFVETMFLPESYKSSLEKGMRISIIYSGSNAVPLETLEYFKNSIAHLKDSIIILLVAVVYLAIDPRILLLGTESWNFRKGSRK